MIKHPVVAILATMLAVGCDSKINQFTQTKIAPLSVQQAADARGAASQLIGSNGRALFICGQADGVGVFTRDWKSGFTGDGMDGGRLVFLVRNDGKEDVFFRDAVGQSLSSLDDGAEVSRITHPEQQIESWVISYPSTGVVESHNITNVPEVGFVDIWTSNKPISVIGASAKLFRSSCVRA
jgi:hypothetical protein